MDILEKARQHFPLETTGQPFQTHELQRIKVVREMADEIERLREALSVIWGWYPTSISNPHSQIKKMREVADLALNDGDFRQYIKNHYAALEEGE